MWAIIITIKRTKDLNYFSLCALKLFNTRVSKFELNYWNKWTFPRHSNLLRCICMCSMQSFFIFNHFVYVSDFSMLRLFFFYPSFTKQTRKTQWKIQTATILKCSHILILLPSYMVMPFVARDLGHIMKRKQLTSKVITYLFYQLLRGLKVCLHSVHCNFHSSFW